MKPCPTFGKSLGKELREARAASETKQLGWETVHAIAQAAYERQYELDHAGVFDAVHQPPRAKKKGSMVGLCDEEWIAELEQDSTFSGIDIKRELGKCQVWMRLRGRQATRRAFVNWLLKAERTIGYSGEGRTSNAAPTTDPYTAPPNWQERAKRLFGDVELPDDWSELGLQIRKDILRRTT